MIGAACDTNVALQRIRQLEAAWSESRREAGDERYNRGDTQTERQHPVVDE